jgi:hypothetical protein
MKLVNEMLDKLPIEVWKNKNLTWLDPDSPILTLDIVEILFCIDIIY